MPVDREAPLIVGFVADLIFTSKIESVARRLGYRVQWAPNAAAWGQEEAGEDAPTGPGEALDGRSGQLFQFITRRQPALLLFDLGNTAVPWRQWIPHLKASPATRRIPILCYGPHVNVADMTLAQQGGADAVLARSRFTADMAALLRQYARLPDRGQLAAACGESLAEAARRGIALFNQGHYYRCHDDLEQAWREDDGPGRILYQGILQTGIALYQIQRGNYRGALKMLLRVRQWLAPLPDVCRGVDVASLRRNVEAIHRMTRDLGPAGLSRFDWSLVKEISVPKDT